MCGLVGVAGHVSVKEEGVFKRLLELDTIRGPHSTGILAVDSAGNTQVVKKVGTPWDLYQYKQVDEIFRASLSVLMGHNRWATKGKINHINAHPFEHEHIIGAHNGTLRNQSLLINHKKFEVDSDNIFYSISEVGVDETIVKTCGAFALTWYDTEQETMNFIRNDERPLWICESEDKRTVFWASEKWMLEVTLGIAGVKYREPYEPKPGLLLSYPIQTTYNKEAFKDVVARHVELHKYPVYAKTTSTAGGTQGNSAGKSEANGNVFDKVDKNGKKLLSPNDLMAQGKVEFFVSSLETSKANTGQQWVVCGATQDDCNIELRIYPGSQAEIDWLMLSVHLFEGNVRGSTTVAGETWATLDPRSIIELIPLDGSKEDDGDEFAVVYGGILLPEAEYDLAVVCGCGNCKTIPTIEQSDELVWVDAQNFICGECKDLPIVRDFVEKLIAV